MNRKTSSFQVCKNLLVKVPVGLKTCSALKLSHAQANFTDSVSRLEKDLDQSVVQHSSLLRRAGAVKKLFDWSNWKCELVFFEMKLLWAKHFHCLLSNAQSYCWSRSWLPIVGFLFLKHTFPSWNIILSKLSAKPPPGSEILS